MKKKIIGISICMLMLVPILSATATPIQEPKLDIEIIGYPTITGATIYLIIKNNGDLDANGITWTLRLKHPIFKILDFTIEGNISEIAAGKAWASDSHLSWIGAIEITMTVNAINAEEVETKATGYVLGPFIRIYEI